MNSWMIKRQSTPCIIKNKIGPFKLTIYELQDRLGITRTVATVSTARLDDNPLVRINSGCITSEIFGDQSCDCGWQLWRSFEMIARDGNGIVIYAAFDEGRGVGLFGKVESIALIQKTKTTSSQAFEQLGFPIDARDFGYAPIILKAMNIKHIRCITNNPAKVEAFVSKQSVVTERIELIARHRHELGDYYYDKEVYQGHQINTDQRMTGRYLDGRTTGGEG